MNSRSASPDSWCCAGAVCAAAGHVPGAQGAEDLGAGEPARGAGEALIVLYTRPGGLVRMNSALFPCACFWVPFHFRSCKHLSTPYGSVVALSCCRM
eukprot:scaffold118081_cov19-Tisochrysis_lutea.AAC.1